MAKAPAFQFYTRDWLASSKTRRMTLAERGLYVEMLAWQFEDGSVPDDPAAVAAMVTAPLKDVEAAWSAVRPRFDVTPRGLVNRRLERARKEWLAFHKERSESGRKGNRSRWGKLKTSYPHDTQTNTETGDSGDRSAIAQQSPASALASALRSKPTALDFDSFEGRSQNGRDPEPIGEFIAALQGRLAKELDSDLNDAAVFLNSFFPPKRPGAGPDPIVARWRAKIPEHEIIAAIEHMRVRTYRWGNGPEMTWPQLEEDVCRKVIIAELNGLLRASRLTSTGGAT